MYVCMYACMHACMHGCMDAWMHGCMDAWMHGCMDVWMYGCMDVWMYGCMDVCMYVCMYNLCIYIYTHLSQNRINVLLTSYWQKLAFECFQCFPLIENWNLNKKTICFFELQRRTLIENTPGLTSLDYMGGQTLKWIQMGRSCLICFRKGIN